MRPSKRRHFRTRLRKAKDVIDEEQHVHALIAEIFGDSQTRQRHAQTRSRRFSHLSVDERHLRLSNRLHVDFGHVELAGVVQVLVELRRQTG